MRRTVAFVSLKLALLVVMVLAACASGGGGSVRESKTPSAGVPTFTSKIRIVPGLAEPLVTTKPTTDAEDLALAEATDRQDGATSPLLAFLAAHPDSGWSAAVHTNLGLASYREGFFSRAIASYEAAWKEGRAATDFRAKTLVDRAVGELAKMHARVGHLKELAALIADIGDRPIQGGAGELLTGAKEGAWSMRHNPGGSYLCGPKALRNLLETLGASPKAIAVADAARSGEHGFTLAQLGQLADQAGLAHRLIHRAPGEPVPVPSVINWRVSHYAAILGRTERGTYQVKDPTFGGDLEISEAAIDEEGSGFFLVPEQAASADSDERLAWRDASAVEAQTAYGMGWPGSYLQGAVTPCDTTADAIATDAAGGAALCNATPTVVCTTCGGMAVANAHAMEVSLNIKDMPVGYAPPVGPPAYVRLTYNQREAVEPYGPPSNPVSFNVGPQWTLNLLSYVLDNPKSPGASVSRYVPGGGAVSPYTYAGAGVFVAEKQSGAVLTRTPATGMATSYTLTGTDGSQLVYAQNDGSTAASTYRRLYMTSIVDPHGNALTLNYDTTLATPDAGADGGPSGFGSAVFFPRLSSITDPNGNTAATFTYGLPATPLLVTQITDAFGRSASITYDGNGRLSSITDVLGIVSTVGYDDADSHPTFINQLTTPYGITKFNYGETIVTGTASEVITRWLETTDPLGATERLEFAEGGSTAEPGIAPAINNGIPATDEIGAKLPLPSGMPLSLSQAATLLMYRNTFFWNKHIYPLYGTGTGKDYTKAELVHWLHTTDGLYVAPTIEAVRHPLENRIWYQYTPSQASAVLEGPVSTYLGAPTTTARVLDDGSTQLTTATRNPLGKPLLTTDPLGRQTQFTYAANNQDLTLVTQKTSATGFSTLASYSYNSQHEPLTFTDASGRTTKYGYYPAGPLSGQLQTVTDALNHVQTVVYDASNRLSKLLDANNLPVLTLTYDGFNRVATRTDSVGYTVSYLYDAFDRVTTVTYPDKTTETYIYTNLDLTSATDRLGQVTTYLYDANRRLKSVTDPMMQVTQYAYYEDGTLKSITDPNNNATSWDIDIQNRPTAKHYADGTSETYSYETTTSRLASKTDALSQVTSYAYNADDSLAGVTYGGSAVAQATAPVSFAYDPVLPRLTSMTDGIGTTTYSYYPLEAISPEQDAGADAGPAPIPVTTGAGRLQFVASPVAGSASGAFDVVGYSYDELGRVKGRSVNGTSQTVTFDVLGRPMTVTNAALNDTFTYAYAGETPRVTRIKSAHGPSVELSYYDPAMAPGQNELLNQMTYTAPSGGQTLSQFTYGYYANGNVQTFTEAHLLPPATGDAGPPGDSGPPSDGSTGMNLPRSLTGPGGPAKLAASVLTRTPLSFGSSGVLFLAGGLLLSALGWLRAGKRRFASALSSVALALVFAACGGGSGAKGTGADAGGAGLVTQVTTYQYDAANRLISATLGVGGQPPVAGATPQYAYGYDPASNLLSIAANGPPQSATFTSTNAIAGAPYDLNGSPKTLGGTQYAWDAANRLISTTANGVESDFTYDGQSRIVRIVETQGTTVTSDKAYTWDGTTRALEHDNTQSGAPPSKQYFAQGVVVSGQGYYYATDRLGSVTQLVDASGAIRAQYGYDPYGNQTKLGGDLDNDFGYAGYFEQAASGLDLTAYRAYDPQQARWLNRDPMGEGGGTNLYAYATDNPTRWNDPFGLYPVLVVTLPNGTQYEPTTTVKNSAQAKQLGVQVGTTVPIAVPPWIYPQELVNDWTVTVFTVFTLADFYNFWANKANNYKAVNPIYDAFGNFAYGATGEAAGFTLPELQAAANLRHPRTGYVNDPINTIDIQSGFDAIAACGKLSTTNYGSTSFATPTDVH